MLAATQAGMFPPITGPEESELKAAAELRPMEKEN
jgi:hypothetical protein